MLYIDVNGTHIDQGLYVDPSDDEVVGSPHFVEDANGTPTITATQFAVDTSLAHETWESIGETSSGEDNEWAAMDSVPSDADWVSLKVTI